MNDRQENYLSMCKATQTTCNDNNLAWSGLGAFVTQFGYFNTQVAALESLKTAQAQSIKGFTLDKAGKKATMIDKCITIAAGVKAFAQATNNVILLEQVNYSKSDLDKARDEVVASHCQIIHDRANDNIASLPPYGVTALQLADAQTSIGDYAAVSQMPSVKEDEIQVITAQIEVVIGRIRDILAIMDNLVKTLALTQPVFVGEYNNSRETYDLGG